MISPHSDCRLLSGLLEKVIVHRFRTARNGGTLCVTGGVNRYSVVLVWFLRWLFYSDEVLAANRLLSSQYGATINGSITADQGEVRALRVAVHNLEYEWCSPSESFLFNRAARIGAITWLAANF